MSKRIKTNYPGVFYRLADRISEPGIEKIFYCVFKKNARTIEEKAGRQYADRMTAAKAARIRAERIDGKRPSPKEIRQAREGKKEAWTLERLFEEYKRLKPDLKSFGPDENRINNYILPAFGGRKPSEIYPLDVERLKVRLTKEKKLNLQSVKHTLSLLRRILNFGANRGLVARLAWKMELPKVRNVKTEDLTEAELGRLFEAIEKDTHPQAGAIMKLALYSGMRKGELFKLQWKHVDFERGFLLLKDPKGGTDQAIPLNEAAKELLLSIPMLHESPYVFPGRSGGKHTDLNKAFNEIKKAADLPKDFRPLHGLRHVFASTLASSGKVDLYTLQKLLTHKDPSMTMRYAHLRDATLRKGSELAGEIFSKARQKRTEETKVVNIEMRRKN